ncbi:MAG: hypothetical protein CXZ00_09025 [Acidobacteria bacterium]|nr:MAG: hypothetical protein CXZ00_09025 [Acidobacteriota bacterium]
MKSFVLDQPRPAVHVPVPPVLPALGSVRMKLQWHRTQGAGDFFDALAINHSRLLFLLMDIDGQRDSTREITTWVQNEFRSRAPELFARFINESGALSELCLHLNRTVLEGAKHTPLLAATFIGVLNEKSGTLTFINAGHVPGLLLTAESNEFLGSTGLPLGIFSHATHEACCRVIPCGGALLMASRSVVETRGEPGIVPSMHGSSEFGAPGLLKAIEGVNRVAKPLCRAVLESAILHAGRRTGKGMSVAAISRDEWPQ